MIILVNVTFTNESVKIDNSLKISFNLDFRKPYYMVKNNRQLTHSMNSIN